MAGSPQSYSDELGAAADRLDSWKEIAVYLKRDVRTVQRWEKTENLPVHRHLHEKQGTVYAFKSKIGAWSQGRHLQEDEPAADVDGLSAFPEDEQPESEYSEEEFLNPAAGRGQIYKVFAVLCICLIQPAADPLRRDPRFPQLLQKLGLSSKL